MIAFFGGKKKNITYNIIIFPEYNAILRFTEFISIHKPEDSIISLRFKRQNILFSRIIFVFQ